MGYVLGLDLGARSIGWAAIVLPSEGRPGRILGAGVRVFEAGMGGAIEQGREESRAVARRTARLARRQIRRRRQRARQLYHALAEAGLLPPVSHKPREPVFTAIQEALNEVDQLLRKKHAADPASHQLPYLLRARALDHKLEPIELGRALYHLGQRRGFKSNRKAKSKDTDEEKGKVYSGIRELDQRLQGKRTLGEYLASVSPEQERIRARYTHRKMYEEEFEAIWTAQEPHHPELTGELKKKVHHILFHQRPLQDSGHLIGRCEWDPNERRAELWRLEYQRFRLLQAVNHLRVLDANKVERQLTPDQRAALIARLETEKDLNFKRARKLLGIPEEYKFSIEEGGETKFKGDAVAAQFSTHVGAAWTSAAPEFRAALVEVLAAATTDEEAAQVLQNRCGLTPDAARGAAEQISLPSGYASLSLKALRAVLPYLEQGLSVQEARQAAGLQIVRTSPVFDLLPPVNDPDKAGIDVYNPAVKRSLTEMRKVVNAVVREWGKPDEIHIETARELRKTKEQRQKDVKINRDREKDNEAAELQVKQEAGLTKVGRREIEITKLYHECGGICPYSGKPLGGLSSILNGTGHVHVEHIIPRSYSLDDSYGNLTLATVEANAEKGNRTPWEAFGGDETRWNEIIERVKAFKGRDAHRKLKLFQIRETGKAKLIEEFGSRQLNDTRYASRLAATYLGLLYGGEIANGSRKVLKATGQITSTLRGLWRLNEILSGDSNKSRDDHRHHAIDAAVLALTSQGWIQRLSEASERAWAERKRRYASVEPPWVGFKEDLRDLIGKMHISHRPDHRVTGALHKESFYTEPETNAHGGQVVRIRKPVQNLGSDDVARIVDPGVRARVEAKLAEVGDAKKLENNWPTLPNRNGSPINIKSVRIELNRAVHPLGRGRKLRYAEGGETHHVEVREASERGKRAWHGDIVSMSEAAERIVKGQPVVNRSDSDECGFLFSLCKDDTIELRDPKGEKSGVWVVKKIWSNQQVILVPEHDARRERERDEYAPRASGLARLAARKVVIDPLGRVWEAHD